MFCRFKISFKSQLSGSCVLVSYNDRALCSCGIRIPSARNRCSAFDKDKCLGPMFGDVGQARTNAAMLQLMIATTSSRTCTKPTVGRRQGVNALLEEYIYSSPPVHHLQFLFYCNFLLLSLLLNLILY